MSEIADLNGKHHNQEKAIKYYATISLPQTVGAVGSCNDSIDIETLIESKSPIFDGK